MRTEPELSRYLPVPVPIVRRDIYEIEERAGRINTSVARLAKRSGVRLTALSQWKSGDRVLGQTYSRDISRLRQALEEEERELLAYLRKAVPRASARR